MGSVELTPALLSHGQELERHHQPVPVVFSSVLQTVVFAPVLSSRPTPAKRAQFEVAKPLPTDDLLEPDVTKIVTSSSNSALIDLGMDAVSS